MTVPILSGMFPDPTICRVGEDFYLANSSFEYAPGVPIHHSRDLVSWTPIGHALTREAQLPLAAGLAAASTGIYAPTLRHHDGRFWLTTTNLGEIRRGHLIVHAEDPAGPWSDPVYTTGVVGIDPDLAWDEHGDCYLTWHDVVRSGISQVKIDPFTGALRGEPRSIWKGSGLANTEGPHLYRRGEWWYLVVAEGGTHAGHGVSVARARTPYGPFVSHPDNPVLSHRSTSHPVQAVGHADLVELPDGTWAAVHLGIRQRGSFPRFHTNGRETFVVGVDWRDDWPVFDEDRYSVPVARTAFEDRFTASAPDVRWVAPGRTPDVVAMVREGGLHLAAGRPADRSESEAVLCCRVRDEAWTASLEPATGDVAFTVRIDDEHWFGIEKVGAAVRVRTVIGPAISTLAEHEVDAGVELVIESLAAPARSFRAGPDRLRAGVRAGGETSWLAEIDGRYVSTEVAGGFTGRMLAVEALGAPAVVRWIRYAPAVEA